jgi:hypothetical protein
MNYILFHIGTVPSYLKYSIESIKIVDSDADIFVCTDKKLNEKNINSIPVNSFKQLGEKKAQIENIFKNTNYENNPLWASSILRIYALKHIVFSQGLEKFVHFDNDVLIYKSFKKISNTIDLPNNKISITKSDKDNLVFGYSYIPSYNLIEELCVIFDDILENYNYYSKHFARGGKLNEMRILGIAEKKYKSSYGQYLDGTHLKRGNYYFKRRYVSTEHIVGREISSKRIEVKFENEKPLVKFRDKSLEVVNLHVHSKRLYKFMPKKTRS